jgi:hypothetical protein
LLIGAFFVWSHHSPEAARGGETALSEADTRDRKSSDVHLASYAKSNGSPGVKRSGSRSAQTHLASADQTSERSGIARSSSNSSELQVAAQDKNDTDRIAQGEKKSSEEQPVSPDKTIDTSGVPKSAAQDQPTILALNNDKEKDASSREQSAKEVVRIVNHHSNIYGLTGLMVTTSAFTLAAKEVAAGVSVLSEKSDRPDYSVLQFPITATYGLTDFIEIGVRTKFIRTDPTAPSTSQSGLGDSELAVKWRLDTHDEIVPELAVGLAGILPTGSDSKGLNEVKNWGMKVLAMATSETKLSEFSFLGLYLEAQAIFLDKGSDRDRYAVINAGLLLPISKDNRLQGMLEYNTTFYKDKTTNSDLLAVNQSGITPGLRYATETMNITAGAQILSKDKNGYDGTIRWIATYGYKF